MSTNNESNSCYAELAHYIDRLEKKDLPWYESSSSRQYWFWHVCTLIALLTGFASSIVAALMKDQQFADGGKLLLTLLPIVGTIASALLTQFHFRELEDLRELGRIEMEDIVLSARGLLAAATDEDACKKAYEETRKRVKELDLSQHRTFTELLTRKNKNVNERT